MTVSTFTQPSYPDQLGTTYPTNIDSCVNVLAQIGQDFAPHAAATPNLTVLIDAGKIIKADGTLVEQAQQTATFVAPAANPRIDRIVIDMLTGVYSIIAGTEAASPTAPAITAGKLPCAQVSLTVGQTQITNANITDERTAFVSDPQVTYHTATGTDTYTVSGLTLVSGFDYRITFTNASTSTAPTVNGTTIKKEGSAALVAGDIPDGHPGVLRSNGVDLILINPAKAFKNSAFAAGSSLSLGASTTLLTVNLGNVAVGDLVDIRAIANFTFTSTSSSVTDSYIDLTASGTATGVFYSDSTNPRSGPSLASAPARYHLAAYFRVTGAGTLTIALNGSEPAGAAEGTNGSAQLHAVVW